ncbi:MAG: preprotein translocase subunit SecG [Planctomycetaceae bacterium]|nr:preprotein translocase subunit SecG [Planctomycetaceae bacterium]
MTFFSHLLMFLLLLTTLFLIVLVLIQRGRGGGLAGAFGGMGGQSAFGTKAGDLFTKITIGVAAFWIILCIVMFKVFGISSGPLNQSMGGEDGKPGVSAPASTDKKPADGKPAATGSAPTKSDAPAKSDKK